MFLRSETFILSGETLMLSTKYVLVTQSCPTVCDDMDCSPPASSVHSILQARILEWAAIPFSRGLSQSGDQTRVPCTAGGFFNVCATKEAPEHEDVLLKSFTIFFKPSILSL